MHYHTVAATTQASGEKVRRLTKVLPLSQPNRTGELALIHVLQAAFELTL